MLMEELLKQKERLEGNIKSLKEEIEELKMQIKGKLTNDEWERLDATCKTLLEKEQAKQPGRQSTSKQDTTEEFREIFNECMKEGN